MIDKNKDTAFVQKTIDTNTYKMPIIKKVGLVESFKEYCYREHTHFDYEWVYISSGTLTFYINEKKYVGNEGDFYFIQPSQLHREECYDNNMNFYYISFYYLDSLGKINYINNDFDNTDIQIIKNIDDDFVNIFLEIIHESKGTKPGKNQVIEALLLRLIWFVKRQINSNNNLFINKKTDKKIEYVSKACDYINNNVNKKITLQVISDYLNISPDYFSHLFKNITGTTPNNYILNAKIDKARFLLANTTKQISEISSSLSFYDQSYFTKHFKKITGALPSDYRKNNRIIPK